MSQLIRTKCLLDETSASLASFEKSFEREVMVKKDHLEKSLECATESEISQHLNFKEEKSRNACDQCGIEKKSGKALMKHRQEEHPGKMFSCN